MRSIKIIANILREGGGGWGGGVWKVMKDKALRSEVGHFDPDHERDSLMRSIKMDFISVRREVKETCRGEL